MTAPVAAVAADFQFLRPLWLLGLAAIPALLWWLRAQRRRREVWRHAVDAHLLPHLLARDAAAEGWRGRLAETACALAAILAILALAGPSWRERPQPLWLDRNPLVIAVDLSSAASTRDVAPSRLLQARAKIAHILRNRGGGQMALVAFADDAYTVSPLTDDAGNIALFVDALSPEIMPRDGSRADLAIEESVRLLRRAGFPRGEILLITDRAGGSANAAAIDARAAGFRVSVLGLGSPGGGRYRQRDGDTAIARLDDGALRRLAASGGGEYAPFAPGDADLLALGVLEADRIDAAQSAQGRRGRVALDEGYWLLPPLLLLALFAFRRGAIALVLLALWLPMPPAAAADLWRREDQQRHAAMARGVDAYRSGDYAAAEAAWRDLPGADAAYNRGNALAKQGRYDEAIAEYDRALRLQPGMPDAEENRRRVEAARRRPPQDASRQRQQNKQQNERQNRQQGSQQGGQGEQGERDRRDPGRDPQRPPQSPPSPPPQKEAQPPQSNEPRKRPQEDARDDGRPQAKPEGATAQPRPPSPPERDPASPSTRSPRDPARDPSADASPPADPRRQAREQREADEAQRARMRRASPQSADPRDGAPGPPGETAAARERRLANEAWLRRVPDDPGGLLRAKFKLEEKRRRREGDR